MRLGLVRTAPMATRELVLELVLAPLIRAISGCQ